MKTSPEFPAALKEYELAIRTKDRERIISASVHVSELARSRLDRNEISRVWNAQEKRRIKALPIVEDLTPVHHQFSLLSC